MLLFFMPIEYNRVNNQGRRMFLVKLLCALRAGKEAFPLCLILFFVVSRAGFVSAQTGQMDAAPVLTRITELLGLSRYDEAIALFDTIDPALRESSRIRLLKASVLSSVGKYDEARAIAEAISAAEPNNTEALFVLAAVEGASGRERQQRTVLERIIKAEPDNADALTALGTLHLRSRSLKNAASYFDRVLKKEPNNPGALLGMAQVLRLSRDRENAGALLNRVVELYPETPAAWSERARYHRGGGQLRLALADLDEAKRLAPGDYWVAIDRGNVLLDLNRKPEALEEFTRAMGINPREFLAYAYTSGLKDDLGDFDGAEQDYAVLSQLRPDYHYALEGLGLHKMKNGKWGEARDAFMEAYKQAPTENHYALMGALNWMRAENLGAPRQFLAQAQAKVKRDTLEWYMFRLYYDLTVRNYVGENDMIFRLDQERDQILKARMLFYMAQYYDIRGNTALANKYFLQVGDMEQRAIPEWRLNEWILTDRNLRPL
jgi:tetratricopeptide (TPR) repeat protein